ncbi:MAG: hypothetical protein VKS61_16810 [Candidatus Sericytochromatia bacterium]|nr:hypothetical protein [Candidatus Sericytochromatia bacterium]
MPDIKPVAPAAQPVVAPRTPEAGPSGATPAIGRRYTDTFSLARMREAAGKAAETGGRWLSQPLQELASLVQTVSAIFSYGNLLAMARQSQARRDEEERSERQSLAVQARRAAAAADARAEEARRTI